MAIVFDGDGHIGGFIANLTGDFDVILPTLSIDSFFGCVFSSDSEDSFIQIRETEVRLRMSAGGTTIDAPPVTVPSVVSDGRITRVGTTVTFTFGGNTATGTSSGALDIRGWGRRSAGAAYFIGEMSGIASITGDSDGVITYDFDGGAQGDTQLTNTSGDYDHGTLIGFTTGGYDTPSTPSPSVANAGADQSNINAGDTVTLDSSASTGAVSRSWAEVTSTGVVLSDNTAVSPTFTAPSFTSLTEIIFRLTTTGTDDSTDTDDVSFFVLEDGVVATDPTITITSPYAYQTRKADALFEAIFTLTGTITDLPAGAFAEYQVDDGSWIQAPTDGSGNFSTDVIITKQQSITVRVSTHTAVTDSVSYITAANTWLAWWQSNESGRGSSTQNTIRNELTDSDPRPTMFKNGVWQRLADPTSEDSTGGSTWVRIAVEFAKLGIPIGLINVAVGGTSIERWIPSSNDLWDTRIIQEVTEADCGGISFTTSLGGESNVGTDGAVLRAWLEEMINALHTEFGTNHYLTYVPRSYEDGLGDTLRGEFDYAIENNPYCLFGGDTSVVDLSVNSDGTHLNSSSQVNEAALIRFNAFTAVEAANQPPTANAGIDQSVAAGVTVQLDGTGSTDGDGTIVSYSWAQTAGDAVILTGASTSTPSFTAPSTNAQQTLTFELTVTDNEAATDTDAVDVVVAAEVVQPIESTLNLTITGISAGSQALKLWSETDNALVYNSAVTFAGESASITLPVAAGTVVTGRWLGTNPPTTGTGIYGVTV
jgi:hypothetical protein